MLSFLFRRRDEYEENLRRASVRLVRYSAELRRHASTLDRSASGMRARELAAARASAAARLALIHSWGLSSILPTFFEQATLVMRRAYVRAAADAAAVGALIDTAAASDSWSRHLIRLADERVADEKAASTATGGRISTPSSENLPLDVDAFCAAPLAILAASAPLARIRARESRITERLLVLDADIRALAPSLAPPVQSSRTAALAAASAAAAADAVAADAAELAAQASVTAAGDGALHPAAAFLFSIAAARANALVAVNIEVRRNALRSLLVLGCLEEIDLGIVVDVNFGQIHNSTALGPLPSEFNDVWSRLSPDLALRVDIAVEGFAALLSNTALRRSACAARNNVIEQIFGDQRFKEGRLLQAWATRVLLPSGTGGVGDAETDAVFSFDLPRWLCGVAAQQHLAFDNGDSFYLAVLRGAGVGAALAGVAHAADEVCSDANTDTNDASAGDSARAGGAVSPAAASAGAYEGLLSPSVAPLSTRPLSDANYANSLPRAAASSGQTGAAPNRASQQLPDARGVSAFSSHFSKEVTREHFSGASVLSRPQADALAVLTEGVLYCRIRSLIFRGLDVISSKVLRSPPVAPRLPVAMAAYGEGAAEALAAASIAGDDILSVQLPSSNSSTAAAYSLAGCCSDLLARRDRIWAAKAHLARASQPEVLGLPVEFTTRLPNESESAVVPFRAASTLMALAEAEVDPRVMAAAIVRAVDAAVAEASARAALAAPPGAAPRALAAEELIPLIVYVAAHARLQRPHADIAFMSNYGVGPGAGGGRADYCVCTLQLAVAWICTQRQAKKGATSSTSANGGGRLGEPRQPNDDCAVRRVAGTPGKVASVNDYFQSDRALADATSSQAALSPTTAAGASSPFPSRSRSAAIDERIAMTDTDTADERAYGEFASTLLQSGLSQQSDMNKTTDKAADAGDDTSGITTMSLATFAAVLDTETDADTKASSGTAGVDDITAAIDDADVAHAELYASLALAADMPSTRSAAPAAAPAPASTGQRLFRILQPTPPAPANPSMSSGMSALRELVQEQDALEGALAVLD